MPTFDFSSHVLYFPMVYIKQPSTIGNKKMNTKLLSMLSLCALTVRLVAMDETVYERGLRLGASAQEVEGHEKYPLPFDEALKFVRVLMQTNRSYREQLTEYLAERTKQYLAQKAEDGQNF